MLVLNFYIEMIVHRIMLYYAKLWRLEETYLVLVLAPNAGASIEYRPHFFLPPSVHTEDQQWFHSSILGFCERVSSLPLS